jgi:peptidoglycan/xylan/chitin deacetylase (PgdA/CDA1 family)
VVNSRAKLKTAVPVIAHYSGISRALAFRYAGAGVIFGLHRIGDDGASDPDEFLSCPTRALERSLLWLKDNGIEVLSLDEALRRLDGSKCEKFCVFAFDDGYADNLTRALPIMEGFNAPFVVYVTTGMLTGEVDAWWLGLATMIRTQDCVELPALGCSFSCGDAASKRRAFAEIRSLIDTNSEALEIVKTAVTARGIDCRVLGRAAALKTEQLQQLAASPLVTIGAHGIRHISLPCASTAEVEHEMAGSRRWLEEIINREVVHFAYPFGACGRREAQIAQSLGFRTAVTTQRGSLFAEHLSHLHALPREQLSRYESQFTLRCKVDGTYRAFFSRFGNPVAHL